MMHLFVFDFRDVFSIAKLRITVLFCESVACLSTFGNVMCNTKRVTLEAWEPFGRSLSWDMLEVNLLECRNLKFFNECEEVFVSEHNLGN